MVFIRFHTFSYVFIFIHTFSLRILPILQDMPNIPDMLSDISVFLIFVIRLVGSSFYGVVFDADLHTSASIPHIMIINLHNSTN